MKKTVALVIMDGYGKSDSVVGNAIASAETPNIDKLLNKYPNTLINASGRRVGLPEGQMGNSEVGHLSHPIPNYSSHSSRYPNGHGTRRCSVSKGRSLEQPSRSRSLLAMHYRSSSNSLSQHSIDQG